MMGAGRSCNSSTEQEVSANVYIYVYVCTYIYLTAMIYQLSIESITAAFFFSSASHQPAFVNTWYQSGLPASSRLYHPSRPALPEPLGGFKTPTKLNSNPISQTKFFMLIRKRNETKTALPLPIKGVRKHKFENRTRAIKHSSTPSSQEIHNFTSFLFLFSLSRAFSFLAFPSWTHLIHLFLAANTAKKLLAVAVSW
jgi:hypothetical protein